MSDSCQSRERQKRFESLNLTHTVCDDDDDDDERQSVNVMFTRGLDRHERIILIILRANNARARTSLSSFATSFRSPKMFSRSFTMPLICRLTRTLLTPPSAAAALPDILRSGARHGCAARLLVKIAHVDARMLSSRRRRISSCATRPHAHARGRHKHWCWMIQKTSFVTLEHKIIHKCTFLAIEIYASSESWINNISIDVWFGQYLKI